MDTHAHLAEPMPERFDRKHFGILPAAFLAAAIIGILGTVICGLLNPVQFAFSYLFAFMVFFTMCVGSLFWILVHHATDAEWSVLVRRQLENVAVLIGALAILVIPMLLCAPLLFKWWNTAPGLDHLLDEKAGYLNIPFFLIRAVAYFVLLFCVAFLARRLSVRQDSDGHPRHTINLRRLSFVGIPILAVSLTFAAIDWLMGLDHHWFSTMWGVYIFAGAAGSSMCLLVLIISGLKAAGYLQGVTVEHYHIMGKLMLAFCIFWAYIGFSQYMLIWYANIPEETSYFLRRNIGSWNILSIILVVGRFFAPFPLLLLQGFKKKTQVICAIAGWLILMQMLDIYIIVMPMLHQLGFHPHLLDIFTVLGLGGILGFVFLKVMLTQPLYPLRDPHLVRSVNLSN